MIVSQSTVVPTSSSRTTNAREDMGYPLGLLTLTGKYPTFRLLATLSATRNNASESKPRRLRPEAPVSARFYLFPKVPTDLCNLVSGITFTDNTASGCERGGVLITQSYPVSSEARFVDTC